MDDPAFRYPPAVLRERDRVQREGTWRERVRFDLVPRPSYAAGLLAAADLARFCAIERITAIEFGVAEGAGLRNLAEIAACVTAETGVAVDVIGFDRGIGLPAVRDHRDHPEIWSEGDFAMGDPAALAAGLPPHARLVLGDIEETLASEIARMAAPVGFVSIDVDLYHSTVAALEVFTGPALHLLPVVVTFFDDVIGSPSRIGSLFRNRWAGQLLAIDEFNQHDGPRKIDEMRTLRHGRPLSVARWLDQMRAVHVLDHPLRSTSASRAPLTMAEHGESIDYAWPP